MAALEKRQLIAVSPAIYHRNYPQGAEPNDWEMMLTHEMCHRLHVRILRGNKGAMGPIWFYEGFAIVGAGQFVHLAPSLTDEDIWQVVEDPKRGSYLKYATVMQHFLQRTTLHDMVARAGSPDFLTWLKGL